MPESKTCKACTGGNCSACGGDGKVKNTTCKVCKGSGECPKCGASGQVRKWTPGDKVRSRVDNGSLKVVANPGTAALLQEQNESGYPLSQESHSQYKNGKRTAVLVADPDTEHEFLVGGNTLQEPKKPRKPKKSTGDTVMKGKLGKKKEDEEEDLEDADTEEDAAPDDHEEDESGEEAGESDGMDSEDDDEEAEDDEDEDEEDADVDHARDDLEEASDDVQHAEGDLEDADETKDDEEGLDDSDGPDMDTEPSDNPKHSGLVMAALHGHAGSEEEYLKGEMAKMDNPQAKADLAKYHSKFVAPRMEHLKAMLHAHHGQDGDDPDELMSRHEQSFETDGTGGGETQPGEAGMVADGDVPPEDEDMDADGDMDAGGDEAAMNGADDGEAGMDSQDGADDDTEDDEDKKPDDGSRDEILERYKTEKGWQTRVVGRMRVSKSGQRFIQWTKAAGDNCLSCQGTGRGIAGHRTCRSCDGSGKQLSTAERNSPRRGMTAIEHLMTEDEHKDSLDTADQRADRSKTYRVREKGVCRLCEGSGTSSGKSCQACGGSGMKKTKTKGLCGGCKGTGKVTTSAGKPGTCVRCGGQGEYGDPAKPNHTTPPPGRPANFSPGEAYDPAKYKKSQRRKDMGAAPAGPEMQTNEVENKDEEEDPPRRKSKSVHSSSMPKAARKLSAVVTDRFSSLQETMRKLGMGTED